MAELSESESSEDSSSPDTSSKFVEMSEKDFDMSNLALDADLMEDSESVKAWLDWCRSHSHARCVEGDVPAHILPKNYTGVLIDVKVGVKGKKSRVPDDKIYLAHADLRQKVARGNCVLELNKLEKGKISSTTYVLLVFALKKFSGGMGDEDDSNCAQSEWTNYFRQPISNARKIVSTEKANGEAAHISCRLMFGRKYYCIGSKNVHLLARDMDDVKKYTEGRYEFARRIAAAFFRNYIDNPEISQEQKESFFSYSHENQFTAVLEMLQPNHQHVVNLSYLTRPELKFICWTRPDLKDDFCGKDTLCPLPVHEALQKAKGFGLTIIDYEIIKLPTSGDPTSLIEEHMEKIRGEHGHEGKVLYFLDSQNTTIGLIKKKTAWYIILRALREKVAVLSSSKQSISLSEIKSRIHKRLDAIQTWLGFSDQYRAGWIEFSDAFVKWMCGTNRKNTDIRANFPVIVEEFLNANEAMSEKYQNLIQSFELKS